MSLIKYSVDISIGLSFGPFVCLFTVTSVQKLSLVRSKGQGQGQKYQLQVLDTKTMHTKYKHNIYPVVREIKYSCKVEMKGKTNRMTELEIYASDHSIQPTYTSATYV